MAYSPWGHKELGMHEQLTHIPTHPPTHTRLPPGHSSVFALGMTYWPLAWVGYREPHPVSLRESLAGLPPYPSQPPGGTDDLIHPLHRSGLTK